MISVKPYQQTQHKSCQSLNPANPANPDSDIVIPAYTQSLQICCFTVFAGF